MTEGDFLYFNSEKLKFKRNSSSFISSFLNNQVFQALPLSTIVEFSYSELGNSCDDYTITNSKLTNDSSRGFLKVTWSLIGASSTDPVDKAVVSILEKANSSRL